MKHEKTKRNQEKIMSPMNWGRGAHRRVPMVPAAAAGARKLGAPANSHQVLTGMIRELTFQCGLQ